MINRIEIISKIFDTRAAMREKKLGYPATIVDVYSIDKKFSSSQLKRVALMLTNPVVQEVGINTPVSPKKFSWTIEIGFLPGVTDNVANTATESIEDLLKIKFKTGEHVYTSQITFLDGNLSEEEVIKIANSLYNPIIQRVNIKSYQQYKKDGGMGNGIPKVKLNQSRKTDEVNLAVPDEELIEIGKKGIKNQDGTRRGPLALRHLTLLADLLPE